MLLKSALCKYFSFPGVGSNTIARYRGRYMEKYEPERVKNMIKRGDKKYNYKGKKKKEIKVTK